MNLDGVSLFPQIKYLDNLLNGGRIDKICQPNKHDLYLFIRQPGFTYTLFISINPQYPIITVTKDAPDNPPEPPTYCMLLRKQVEGGRIAGVNQLGLDRIITIDIDLIGSKGIIITKTLIIELVGNYSNIILLQDGFIIDALRRIGSNNNRLRTILPGYNYILPPLNNNTLNSINMKLDEFKTVINSYDDNIFDSLLKILQGFGAMTVKEILYRSNLEGTENVLSITESSIEKLYLSIKELLSEVNSDIALLYSEVKIASPFYLKSLKDMYKPSIGDDYNKFLEILRKEIYVSKLPKQHEYLKIVKNEEKRLKKKIKILTKELLMTDKAEDYKIKADILMTYQYEIEKTYVDSEVFLPNIYSETAEKIKIFLDKKYSIMDNIQNYYKKYDKLKRAKKMIAQQIIIAKENLYYVESLINSIEQCLTISDLEDIKNELVKSKIIVQARKKQMPIQKSKPYRFVLPNGMELLVGKNNIQNDFISFKVAKNDDIWLHTKDIPGSHVIILTNGDDVDMYNLGIAAQIAIYFSKGRNSTNVQVDYLRKKYLKKPSGSKPGFTVFTNNKTIFATVDENIIFPIIKGKGDI